MVLTKDATLTKEEIHKDAVDNNAACLSAMKQLSSSESLSLQDRSKCERIAAVMAKRPLIGRIVEKALLHAYFEGNPNATTVDWVTIIQWFIANAPQILQLLLSLLALFA